MTDRRTIRELIPPDTSVEALRDLKEGDVLVLSLEGDMPDGLMDSLAALADALPNGVIAIALEKGQSLDAASIDDVGGAIRRVVPATKLIREADDDPGIIVLECECGSAVDYPGHPDERTAVTCRGCGKVWTLKPTT